MFQENQEPNLQSESQEPPKSEKEILWDQKNQEINEIADKLGKGIDFSIKETVIALDLLGFPLDQSCEGHFDSGVSASWIRLEASNRPKERFIGEKEIFQKAADRYNITIEQITQSENFRVWSEAFLECKQKGETEEYRKWRESNKPFIERMEQLLEEFYRGRDVSESVRLKIYGIDGAFELLNGGEDYRPAKKAWESMSDTERQALQERLKTYQQEMQDFGKFLKDKFFAQN